MPAPSDIPIAPGTLIGPYRVESFLARGGMGVVLRAVDENLGRPVALKVIDPRYGQDREFLERFARECRVLAAIRHPHIVDIYYQDEWEGMPFFAMEFVGGFSLDRVLENRRLLPWRQAATWMRQCCEALEAARRKDILHRDLKPANILIDADDAVRIVDFGLAKQSEVSAELTSKGIVLGTPDYLSPEQARGRDLDWRTDLYSLGATFYQALSGRSVFEASSVAEILVAHIREMPRPLTLVTEDLPEPLCDLVDRLLAKDPASRGGEDYQETIQALEAILSSEAPPDLPSPASSAPTRAMPSDKLLLQAASRPSGSVSARDLAPPLFAWLVPDDDMGGPHVAILRGETLEFGASTERALFTPDEPGERRRLSRLHGSFRWTGDRYGVSPRESPDRSRVPQVRIDGALPLEVGVHPVAPGQVLALPSLTLELAGSHEGGLRIRFRGKDNRRADEYRDQWFWVLFGHRLLAGTGEACGLPLPAEAGADEVFALRYEDDRLVLDSLSGAVRVAGEVAEGFEVLADGDRIEGPGFAYTLSLRETAAALWES